MIKCGHYYSIVWLHCVTAAPLNKTTVALGANKLCSSCIIHPGAMETHHADLRWNHYSTFHLGEVQGFTKRPLNVGRLFGSHLLATHIAVFICANCCMFD